MTHAATERPVVGEYVDGIDVPVVDERVMRAGAGILFALGFAAYLTALLTGFLAPLRGFGMLFAIDLFVRVFIGSRFAPSLVLGKLAVQGQRPRVGGGIAEDVRLVARSRNVAARVLRDGVARLDRRRPRVVRGVPGAAVP